MRNYIWSMKMTYETGIDAIDAIAQFTEGSLNVLYGKNLDYVREEAIKIAKGIANNFKDNYSLSSVPVIVRGFNNPEDTDSDIIYKNAVPIYDVNIANLVKDVCKIRDDRTRLTYDTGLRVMDLKTGEQDKIIKQVPAIVIIDDIEYLFGSYNEIPYKTFDNLKTQIKDSGIILIGTSNKISDKKDTVQDSYTCMIRKLIDVKLCVDWIPTLIDCFHNTIAFNHSLDLKTKMQMYM